MNLTLRQPINRMMWLSSLAVTMILCCGSAQAAWTLLDNFEGLNAGDTVDGTVTPGVTWDGGGTVVYTAEVDPDDASNLAMRVTGDSGNQALRAQFNNASSNIAAGGTGTLYYRFRTPVRDNGTTDSVVALTDNDTIGNFNFKSGLRTHFSADPDPIDTNLDVRNGGSYETLNTLEDNTWYSVWMVSTNTDPGTFSLYLQSDTDAAYSTQQQLSTTSGNVFDYRINGPTDIINAYFRGANNADGMAGNDLYYDDIWINGDSRNLNFPSSIPEPTSIVLLASGLGLLLMRRR